MKPTKAMMRDADELVLAVKNYPEQAVELVARFLAKSERSVWLRAVRAVTALAKRAAVQAQNAGKRGHSNTERGLLADAALLRQVASEFRSRAKEA